MIDTFKKGQLSDTMGVLVLDDSDCLVREVLLHGGDQVLPALSAGGKI